MFIFPFIFLNLNIFTEKYFHHDTVFTKLRWNLIKILKVGLFVYDFSNIQVLNEIFYAIPCQSESFRANTKKSFQSRSMQIGWESTRLNSKLLTRINSYQTFNIIRIGKFGLSQIENLFRIHSDSKSRKWFSTNFFGLVRNDFHWREIGPNLII